MSTWEIIIVSNFHVPLLFVQMCNYAYKGKIELNFRESVALEYSFTFGVSWQYYDAVDSIYLT